MSIRWEWVRPGSNYEQPPMTNMSACIRCGALVATEHQDVHDNWHEQPTSGADQHE